MSHIIQQRDLVWYVGNVAFGIHFKQWGLLITWGKGWWEIIVLCFQITVETDVPDGSSHADVAEDKQS